MPVSGPCASCGEPAKYACPRCSRPSCSLACSSAHKLTDGCSGERDRAAYVPLSAYGPGALLDDFRYLEDVGRRVSDWGKGIADPKLGGSRQSGRGRGRGRGGGEIVQLGRRAPLPPMVAKLRRSAADRGLEIIFLSEGMARRKANKSCLQSSLLLDLTLAMRLSAGWQPSPSWLPCMHLRKSDSQRSLLDTVRARLVDSTGSLPAPCQAELRAAAALHDGLAFVMRVPQVLQAQQMPSSRVARPPSPPPQPSTASASSSLHPSLPARPGSIAALPPTPRPVTPAPPAKSKAVEAKPPAIWILQADVPLIEALDGCTCVEWPEIEVWTKPALDQAVREGRLDVLVQAARAVKRAAVRSKPMAPQIGDKRKRDEAAPAALVAYESDEEVETAHAEMDDFEGGEFETAEPLSDGDGGEPIDDLAIAAAAAGDLSAWS